MDISLNRSVTLILTDEEAHLLQGMVQNPPAHWPEDVHEFCEKLFSSLKDANGR